MILNFSQYHRAYRFCHSTSGTCGGAGVQCQPPCQYAHTGPSERCGQPRRHSLYWRESAQRGAFFLLFTSVTDSADLKASDVCGWLSCLVSLLFFCHRCCRIWEKINFPHCLLNKWEHALLRCWKRYDTECCLL